MSREVTAACPVHANCRIHIAGGAGHGVSEHVPTLEGVGMRIGKSAAGEMHLAAAVYCAKCNMLVELGTSDCPHAIELHEKTRVVDVRSKVYNSLLAKFAGINSQLNEYGRTELDVLLWDLAYQLVAP